MANPLSALMSFFTCPMDRNRLTNENAVMKAQLNMDIPRKPTVVGAIKFQDLYDNYVRKLPIQQTVQVNDTEYDIIPLAEWQDLFVPWMPDQNLAYVGRLQDCDDYEMETEYWAQKWGLTHNVNLCLGAANGWVPGGYHAWNILFGRDTDGKDKLAYLDYTPGWPWRKKVHITGGLWEQQLNLVWV